MIPAYTVTHVRSWTWIKFSSKPDETIRQRIYKLLHARHCHGRGEWYIRSHVDRAEIARVIGQDSSTIVHCSNSAHNISNGGDTMTPDETRVFVNHYLAAAKWADGEDHEFDNAPESPELRQQAEADCMEFAKRAGDMIAGNETHAAHDFWLTRSGCGAGFWDGDWPEHGDELTAICKAFPELDLYTGDDGLLYFGGYQEPKPVIDLSQPATVELTRQQKAVLKYIASNPGCSISDVAGGVRCKTFWAAQQIRNLVSYRWVYEYPVGQRSYYHRDAHTQSEAANA